MNSLFLLPGGLLPNVIHVFFLFIFFYDEKNEQNIIFSVTQSVSLDFGANFFYLEQNVNIFFQGLYLFIREQSLNNNNNNLKLPLEYNGIL